MIEVVKNWALHAFADGELEGDEKLSVEKLLNESDEARKALAAINYQKAELRKAYGAALHEPVPQSLLAATQIQSVRKYAPLAAMAASVALLLMGGAGGWYASQNAETMAAAGLERRALVAHEVFSVEIKHPFEVAAADQDHLQKWLSKRIGTEFNVPDLSESGFNLLGGRLLAGESSPAGQLMYEAENKQRLTVFISSNGDGKNEALRLERHGQFTTCYWRDGSLAVAVTGEMADENMMALAKDIYEKMEKG